VEIVFDKLQLGVQTGTPAAPGAAVAATYIFPIDAGLIDPELDRGYESPDEDYGELSRHQPGRASYGIRGASVPITAVARFEDLFRLFEMRLSGGVAPTGTDPYTRVYILDNTADTTRPQTAEVGSESSVDEYQLSTCVITDFELGFDALTAPGDHPWKISATLKALNRTVATLTAALSAPSGMETIEGHLSTLSEGTTATAFGSLAELANHLLQYRVKISGDRPYRSAGGPTDIPYGYGIVKPEVTVEALVRNSASSKASIVDIFNAAGAVAGDRRWRITAPGSNSRALMIDHRVRFTTVKREDVDGQACLRVNADAVKDATLASSLQATLINHVAA
jgi:hypothetical protein